MFKSNDIYSSHSEGYEVNASLSFMPVPSAQPKAYSLNINIENAHRLEELFVETDESGSIRAASYNSGAQVRHLDAYTMVRSSNNSLWMGDRHGSWHPLD